MDTPTRDEPGDSAEQALLNAAHALGEQTPVTGSVAHGPSPVFNLEDFMRQVDNLPFSIDNDFSNQVFHAQQQSVQLADWGIVATPGPSQQTDRATSLVCNPPILAHWRPQSSPKGAAPTAEEAQTHC
jgi:hypothetical protein